jgi:hypothetical protein
VNLQTLQMMLYDAPRYVKKKDLKKMESKADKAGKGDKIAELFQSRLSDYKK